MTACVRTYGRRTRAAGHTFQVLMLSGDEGSLLGCSSEELQAVFFFGLGFRLGYFIAASSMLFFRICVGLAVDYAAHIAHMFKDTVWGKDLPLGSYYLSIYCSRS